MNKVKVMHVVSDSNFGGAGKYLLEICKYIDKEKYEITSVVPKGSILVPILLATNDTKVIEIDGIDTKSFDLLGVKEIKRVIENEKPNIVHSHACLSARVAAKLKGIKRVIYTRHSISPESKGIKKIIKILIARVLNDKAIAVSKAVYGNLISQGERKDDIYLVYNGVEISHREYDNQYLRKKYNLPREELIITLVGRLETVKGQDHLLEVAKILRTKADNFKVLLVGEGSNRARLEDYVNENQLPVLFLGHIKEIDEIYSLSDIVVNTSNSEALSFSVLEGFSHKKPVVAFNIEGLKEVIIHEVDGYLINFKDYDEFAKKIFKLINNEDLRHSFGNLGYEKVKSQFNVQDMVKNIENIYGGM